MVAEAFASATIHFFEPKEFSLMEFSFKKSCKYKIVKYFLLQKTVSKLIHLFLKINGVIEPTGSSKVFFHPFSYRKFHPGAKIKILSGDLLFGYPFPDVSYFPSYTKSVIAMGENSQLVINGDVNIVNGCIIKLAKNAILSIGDGTSISQNNVILCGAEIEIGKNCLFSWNIQIMDLDGHKISRKGEIPVKKSKKIKICDNVWICSNATICKGVTIGEGSVVGANSVVTCDIPPFSVAVGNPAKVVRENIAWEK